MAASASTTKGTTTRRPRNQRRNSPEKSDNSPKSAKLLWISAHLGVLALAIFSWAWCSQLFSTPETPGHYGFLKQIGLLPELEAYSTLQIPAGESCPPPRFHQRHSQLADHEKDALNRRWLRDYIRNYDKAEKRLYLTGDYEIRGCRNLTEADPISDGLLITLRAQVQPEGGTISSDYPVLIHWILPGTELTPEAYPTGIAINLQKIPDSLTPLHVTTKTEDGFTLVTATVISLAYGEKSTPAGTKLTSTPPDKLRLRQPWPDEA